MYITNEDGTYELLIDLDPEDLDRLRVNDIITVTENSFLATHPGFKAGEEIQLHHIINALQTFEGLYKGGST